MNVVRFFDSLATTTKTTEKKELLAEAGLWEKALLKVALNRQDNYYVSGRIIDRSRFEKRRTPDEEVLLQFMSLVKDLATRKVTGNAAIARCELFFSYCDEDMARVLSKILFREAIGVDVKLVNSVHEDLIPEFEVMLAPNQLPEDLSKDVTYPKIAQPKLDGFRCVTFVNDDGTVDMVTRNGKTIKNPILTAKVRNALQQFRGRVFDGEIYRHGWKLQKIVSIANTEEPTGQKALDSEELTLNLWDVMTDVEWAAQKTNKPYWVRYVDLKWFMERCNPVIQLVDSETVETGEQAKALNRKHLADGYEGTMLKDPEAGYAWKRATFKQQVIIKVKEFETGDFEIIGYEQSTTGKRAGKLGCFIVSLRGHPVGVGSGYDADEVDEFWEKRDEMIGKIMEVRYFEEIETDGKPSLWHPTFVRMREDK